MLPTRQCDDLDLNVCSLRDSGYRLDMIMPADSPREAIVSRNGERLRLVSTKPTEGGTQNGWVRGRAGMMYCDLLPGRLEGKLIASHIRLTQGGPVADYVHYHKIAFQMIYCLTGKIRVVYQDQGEPFWLEPGDCVLQPPEIRHRVLEAEAGSEVIEVSSPAEHETWLDHELGLPTTAFGPDRDFGGQTFVRHIAKAAVWKDGVGREYRDLGIASATRGLVDAKVIRSTGSLTIDADEAVKLVFVLKGSGTTASGESVDESNCVVVKPDRTRTVTMAADSEILSLELREI